MEYMHGRRAVCHRKGSFCVAAKTYRPLLTTDCNLAAEQPHSVFIISLNKAQRVNNSDGCSLHFLLRESSGKKVALAITVCYSLQIRFPQGAV